MMRVAPLLLTGLTVGLGLPALAGPATALDLDGSLSDLIDDEGVPLPTAPRIAPTIINGDAVGDDAWPSAGGLLANITIGYQGQRAEFTMFMCSSTLIAPDVVLTAAHCVDEEFLEAQFGGFVDILDLEYMWSPQEDLSMYGLGGPTTPPRAAAVGGVWNSHPQWVGVYGIGIRLAENHDIALVYLDEPVLDIQHAYLPLPEEVDQLVEGAPVTIVGWGNQRPVPQGQQPAPGMAGVRRASDTVIGAVGPTEFQVGPETAQGRKCQGDSGGPTFQQVTTDRLVEWRVIGVTSHSWDETQCENTGGVDTRVDYYLGWIDAELRAACADGTRSWCDEEGIIEPPFPLEDELESEGAKACGCASPATPASAVGLLGVLALALGRRRRR